MAEETGQISEEEEFEFRHRMEMEQGQQAVPAPSPKAAKANPGFFDEHPNVRTALQLGVPLAAGLATVPFTGGMSLAPLLMLEGGAGLASELGLQAAGVNERSNTQLGLAALAPAAGRAAFGLIQNVPRLLPGFASSFGASIADDALKLPEKLLGTNANSVKAAYDTVKQGNTAYRMTAFPELKKAITKLSADIKNNPLETLSAKIKESGLEPMFQEIDNVIAGAPAKTKMVAPTAASGKAFSLPTGLPKQTVQAAPARLPGFTFEEAKSMTEGFGSIIRNTTDPGARGAYQKLYKAALSDMEKAPMPSIGGAPVKEWQAARQLAKYNYANQELVQATEMAMTTKDGVTIFNPNKVVDWLHKTDHVKSRVSAEDFKAIDAEYRRLAKMKGHDLSKLIATLVGGFTGGSGGAAAAYIGAEQLSKGMMTETGRKLVRATVSDPSESNFRRLGMLLGTGTRALTTTGQDE
jgi:hypothetical protein